MDAEKQESKVISQTAWDMLYLIHCAIEQSKPDFGRLAQMDQKRLYALASFHSLTALVGTALEGMNTGEMETVWKEAVSKAIRKTLLFDAERAELFSWMEERKIWYAPLKGVVLKDYYPVYGTRQMADNDILYDASHATEVRDWFVQHGYEVKVFAAGVHDSYLKAPIFNFEMHRMLFSPSQETWSAYYENVKDRLIKDEGNGYGYHFTDEDFYVYFFTHAAKHFTGGGTGLRSLIDLYLYISNKPNLDWSYIEKELEKLRLREDEKNMRELANAVFGRSVLLPEEALTSDQYALLYTIISSGTYGTITQRITNTMRKNGWGRLRYMLHRFFVPMSKTNPLYSDYAGQYPFFYKHRILLPLLPFYRTFRAMKDGRFRAEARAISKAAKEQS